MYVCTYEIDFGSLQRIRAEETQHDTETTKRNVTKQKKSKANLRRNEIKSSDSNERTES